MLLAEFEEECIFKLVKRKVCLTRYGNGFGRLVTGGVGFNFVF